MVTRRKEAILKVKEQVEDWGFGTIEVAPEVDQALEIIQDRVFSLVFIHENREQPWVALEMGLLIRNLRHTPIIFLSSPSEDQQNAWSLLLLMERARFPATYPPWTPPPDGVGIGSSTTRPTAK